MNELSEIEENIVEALGDSVLTTDEVAVKAGYEVGGHLRRVLSSMRKRGILGNKQPGYYVLPP